MNGPSRYARTEVVAQAAALQSAARRFDQALTSGAPVNQQRYEARTDRIARTVSR
ncbi:hypothetical protein ACH4T9_12880 [Micromonospora sp. NPDC020750]|uniref:hypothetical protein n=1 Tax=unclassified Micromonospora TaxID=2617518 RepID=UPI003795345B